MSEEEKNQVQAATVNEDTAQPAQTEQQTVKETAPKSKKGKQAANSAPEEQPRKKPQKTEGGITNDGIGYRCNYVPEKKAIENKRREKKKELGVGKWTAKRIGITVLLSLIAVGVIAAVIIVAIG